MEIIVALQAVSQTHGWLSGAEAGLREVPDNLTQRVSLLTALLHVLSVNKSGVGRWLPATPTPVL